MAFVKVTSGFDDQATTGTNVAKGPLVSTAGNLLLVFVRCKPNNLTVSTIVDTAGDTFVSCGSTSVDTSNYRTELFYAANCKGNASNTVTVTMSGTVTDLAIAVIEYSGAATGTPFDKAITGNAASGTAWSTASLTPTNASELALSFACATTSFTGTAGTGYTQTDNNGTTGNVWLEHILGTSAAQTGAWTSNTNEGWQVVQAFFSATNIVAGITPQDFEQHTAGRPLQPWNPERSHLAWGISPTVATVPPKNGPPKAVVLPDFFMRPFWNPERTHLARAAWTQATLAIPPTWKDMVTGPQSFVRPNWNPEKSEIQRPASIQSTWAIPPTHIPEPELPESITRPLWNPERSHSVGVPYVTPTWPTTVLQPDQLTRPAWNPERTHLVGITYLPPRWPTTVVLPDGFTRPTWNAEKSHSVGIPYLPPTWPTTVVQPERVAWPVYYPERGQLLWNPQQFGAVVVPTFGYEVKGAETFLRTAWNPERSDSTRAGWTQSLWAIPPTKIPEPVLPESFARPVWNPERSDLALFGFFQVLPPWGWTSLYPDQPYPVWCPDRGLIATPIIVSGSPAVSRIYAVFVMDD